jgi:hypothetical protein
VVFSSMFIVIATPGKGVIYRTISMWDHGDKFLNVCQRAYVFVTELS